MSFFTNELKAVAKWRKKKTVGTRRQGLLHKIIDYERWYFYHWFSRRLQRLWGNIGALYNMTTCCIVQYAFWKRIYLSKMLWPYKTRLYLKLLNSEVECSALSIKAGTYVPIISMIRYKLPSKKRFPFASQNGCSLCIIHVIILICESPQRFHQLCTERPLKHEKN